MTPANPPGRWLRLLRGTATLASIAALCVAVAELVLAFIPRSPVRIELPTDHLSGLDGVHGVTSGVNVDRVATILFRLTDPSLTQRLVFVVTVVPGLVLVAVVARRLATVLHAAETQDPFTAETARRLTALARLTAVGGVAVWAVAAVADAVLATTVLASGSSVPPHDSPLWWLVLGLVFAAFGQLVARGTAMRTELDSVI